MINHARTLLLNITGRSPGADFVGEQYVPDSFEPLKLPTYMRVFRTLLFGSNPDRAMANYRGWQLMTLLHATELAEFVTEYDPRITYTNSLRQDLFEPETFKPVITRVANTTTDLYIQGLPDPPDVHGRMRHRYLVDILTSSTVEITQQTPPIVVRVEDYVNNSGISDRHELGDSGYGCLFSTVDLNSSWYVEVLNRPQRSLGEIVNSTRRMGEPLILQLFGTARVEPLFTFKNLWANHKELPYQLGGLLLAYIHRAEQIRVGANV